MFHRRNILSNVPLPPSHPAGVRYNASHNNDTTSPIPKEKGLAEPKARSQKRPASQARARGPRIGKAPRSKEGNDQTKAPSKKGQQNKARQEAAQDRPAGEKRPICNRPAFQKRPNCSFPEEARGGKKEPGRLGGTADKVTLARTNKPEHGPCSGEFFSHVAVA